MKSLPALVILAATAAFVALAAAAALDIPLPYWSVALRVAALAWAAGAVGVFAADYAPRRTSYVPVAVPTPACRPVRARVTPAVPAEAVDMGAMATLGFDHDPATVSFS